MNKQAYLKMMNYGMNKQVSQMQQLLLYKIAAMNKEEGLKQWWQKDGNKTRLLWLAFLRWLKSFWTDGSDAKKSAAAPAATASGNTNTTSVKTNEQIQQEAQADHQEAKRQLLQQDKDYVMPDSSNTARSNSVLNLPLYNPITGEAYNEEGGSPLALMEPYRYKILLLQQQLKKMPTLKIQSPSTDLNSLRSIFNHRKAILQEINRNKEIIDRLQGDSNYLESRKEQNQL